MNGPEESILEDDDRQLSEESELWKELLTADKFYLEWLDEIQGERE